MRSQHEDELLALLHSIVFKPLKKQCYYLQKNFCEIYTISWIIYKVFSDYDCILNYGLNKIVIEVGNVLASFSNKIIMKQKCKQTKQNKCLFLDST